MKKINILICLFAILSNIVFVNVYAESEDDYITEMHGLVDMSDAHWEEFNSKLPMIVDVKPNSIALSRFLENNQSNAELNEVITPMPFGKEVSYQYPGQTDSSGTGTSEFPLKSCVDISQELTFPPVCNQGSRQSCVAWSLCYYQLTNNNCVARGVAAKNSLGQAVNENIMSPRFIYTLINGGKDVPTYYDEACAAIMSYGCPSVADYSANITTSNLREWCTDSNVWNKAIYNKPEKIAWEPNYNIEPENANTDFVIHIKKHLSNGYVVTMPTYVDSFIKTQNTSNGEWGCRYVSSTKKGSHAMTIVGYDDDFWVDVNNNNIPDNGELGAFKIANSYGTSGKLSFNSGYIWMAYDAIGMTSAFLSNNTQRTSAFKEYYYLEPKVDYTPLLVANVELTTCKRNQIVVEFGVSDEDKNVPNRWMSVVPNYNIAFNNASRGFVSEDTYILDRNFSGGTTSQTVSISFDLTPIIKQCYGNKNLSENTNIKIYVKVTDAVDNGFDVTLGNVTITEPITGKVVACTNTNNLVANNGSVDKMTSFQISPFVKNNPEQDIVLEFSSNVKADTVAGNIYLSKDNQSIYPEYEVVDNKIIICAQDNEKDESQNISEYINDTDYEIHIGQGIRSEGGNSLSSEKVILIYMLGKYFEY